MAATPRTSDTHDAYDLIGDIHGHAKTLEALLGKLGYAHDGQCYRHPNRQVIFLGDFVDRGPYTISTFTYVARFALHSAPWLCAIYLGKRSRTCQTYQN
jgi:hypothetical protein